MKFIVRRTSAWYDTSPCKEAKKGKVPDYDQRTFKTPEDFNKKLKQDWFARGTEHSVNKIGIIRRLDDADVWYIKIRTIKELIKFRDKYGSIIISSYYCNRDIPSIEIYDDYRE